MSAPSNVDRPAEPLRIEEPDYVIVTPEMEAAGLDEIGDHRYGQDLAYLVRSVYIAMEYERRGRSRC